LQYFELEKTNNIRNSRSSMHTFGSLSDGWYFYNWIFIILLYISSQITQKKSINFFYYTIRIWKRNNIAISSLLHLGKGRRNKKKTMMEVKIMKYFRSVRSKVLRRPSWIFGHFWIYGQNHCFHSNTPLVILKGFTFWSTTLFFACLLVISNIL
jgi:hypothetical protein